MGRDGAVGIATTLRTGRSGDGIPVGTRFSAPFQTGPGAYPTSCTMGTGSSPGVKRPGRGADHPSPSKRRGHERVLTLWTFMACYGSTFVVALDVKMTLLCDVTLCIYLYRYKRFGWVSCLLLHLRSGFFFYRIHKIWPQVPVMSQTYSSSSGSL